MHHNTFRNKDAHKTFFEIYFNTAILELIKTIKVSSALFHKVSRAYYKYSH